jgi:hypothetical protein
MQDAAPHATAAAASLRHPLLLPCSRCRVGKVRRRRRALVFMRPGAIPEHVCRSRIRGKWECHARRSVMCLWKTHSVLPLVMSAPPSGACAKLPLARQARVRAQEISQVALCRAASHMQTPCEARSGPRLLLAMRPCLGCGVLRRLHRSRDMCRSLAPRPPRHAEAGACAPERSADEQGTAAQVGAPEKESCHAHAHAHATASPMYDGAP